MAIITTIDYGRLTADPTTSTTGTGRSCVKMSVAADTGRKDEFGEKAANFFNVTIWGKEGENAVKYLRKGDPVSVTGKFFSRKYIKDGQERTSLDIDALVVTYLPKAKRDDAQQAAPAQANRPQRRQQKAYDSYEDEEEDVFS